MVTGSGKISKSLIDKAGRSLSGADTVDELRYIELEDVFDEYRKNHLGLLTEFTAEIQNLLQQDGRGYYIAQRLKRKPQIVRKLGRFSVRLTQLQDIGGCRIIVNSNKDVDQALAIIKAKIAREGQRIVRITDYRQKGRDDSGYRALHIIVDKSGYKLELQIRSNIQHYWAENIERTSVVYGHYLKEGEGDQYVIQYFKLLSDLLHDVEGGIEPEMLRKTEFERCRLRASEIVEQADTDGILSTTVADDVVKPLISKQKSIADGLNNWILVFDWKTGSFVHWDVVSRDPDVAAIKYVEFEKQFPAIQNFEVVLIGVSDIETIKKTHSHYFGVDKYANILDTLEVSINIASKDADLSFDEMKVLGTLYRKKYFGQKTIDPATLKNHYCNGVVDFDGALRRLIEKGFVIRPSPNAPVSLDQKRKAEIANIL